MLVQVLDDFSTYDMFSFLKNNESRISVHAQNEMVRLEELNRAKEEVAKAAGEKKPVTQRSFRAV